MGGSMASYSNPLFEPTSLSKAQLEGVLQSFSEVVAEIAKYYKELGEAYHELPLHVRFHALVPKHWRDYCVDAFISSDTRELPDMIQLINMLKEAFARARAAILCEEYGLAISRLNIAAHLIIEAEDRAVKLTYALECYEALEEELKNLTGAEAYAMLCRQAVMGTDIPRALSKVVWRQSLPQSLQEVEDAAPGYDSGYNSGRSSVIPESQ
ncbi:unnamed protein product [Cercospora beticola]|nr:unnamed protein product [Cercospora beticola]